MDLPTIIIPAYQPTNTLLTLIKSLRTLNQQIPIIVINDGSDPLATKQIFTEVKQHNIMLLEHETNQGKGVALKTGFKYYLNNLSEDSPGVITADADGQHSPKDIQRLAMALTEQPKTFHLGVRTFNRGYIPLRSRIGNGMTRLLFSRISHHNISDTQTGLRAIPNEFVKSLLQSKLSGYDFELEMLLQATELKLPINEVHIETIYDKGNTSSHFNPIVDSLKIYYVLFRFALISMSSAVIDYVMYCIFFLLSGNLLLANTSSRLISGFYNYRMNKLIAFKSKQSEKSALIKYITLAICLCLLSYLIISALRQMNINIYLGKIIAEGLLFVASFTMQRLFVFKTHTIQAP